MSEKNFFVHIFGGMWRVWDFLCRAVINAVITVIVLLLMLGAFGARHIIMPSSAALVVDLQGSLVEQFSGDPTERAINRLLGQKQQPQTRLRDVVGAIDKARDDGRIKALVLETDEMQGAGMEQLQYIAHALRDFEKSGKPVYALGDSYDQAQYYLASMADVVFIHPQGEVFLRGFGVYQPYFKDALDKLGVDWNVFRVGKYKSAVEPFIRNDMSPDAREDYTGLLDSLWTDYQAQVTQARKLPGDSIKNYIDGLPANLAAVGGDGAKLALDARLVDKIADHDQMEDAVARVVGRANHSFRGVEYRQYLDAVDGDGHGPGASGGKVGVVVAEGDIMDGDQPPGSIGGDSTSELIREARYDDSIKALVLRVDSPGGSSFASDLILREIELTKEAGKPVVVSMGDVAASGGYWISMAGDKIYASRSTITGSIGIFGMLPTFQDSLSKIGVHTDGVGTTKLSDAFDVTRPMAPEMKQAFQLTIDHGYQEFITKVAKHRHMKVDDVDAIAQGRVWAGSDAKRLGLVDAYGDLDDAVAEAAKLADMGNRYSVDYIEKQPSFLERALTSMADDSDTALSGFRLPAAAALPPWYAGLMRLAGSLAVFDDPHGIYAYCFCDVR
ncbi:MAG TPA: signal peptide peptidase SppA [Gammaproteobacteria bacterium]|jgi:protease-4|nr:signal peptide peptidase SppA [Gammaproteobacteria bacterium]